MRAVTSRTFRFKTFFRHSFIKALLVFFLSTCEKSPLRRVVVTPRAALLIDKSTAVIKIGHFLLLLSRKAP